MNYDALMGFEIPEARQTFGPLDAVRYALSIGLGHDPLDPWQLQFVDDHKGPRIVPSFCSVLGHPGFWLADPRTTVDAGRLVHAEHGFSLKGPIPSAGTVVGDTRIVDIVDKGAAKGALLYLEKTLRDDGTGAVIATETRTLMLRGDGGYDGPCGTPRPAPEEPDEPPDRTLAVATRPEQALLYRLNGDPNPLHLDPAVAQKAGFGRPILHGLCTFGIACHALSCARSRPTIPKRSAACPRGSRRRSFRARPSRWRCGETAPFARGPQTAMSSSCATDLRPSVEAPTRLGCGGRAWRYGR